MLSLGVIKNFFLLLLFLTPLLFSPISSELFEFPKILLLYGLTIIIVGLHLVNVFSQRVHFHRPTLLDFPLILFFLSQAVSTLFSIDRHTSIFGYYSRFNGGLLSLLCYLLLYFVIVNYLDHAFQKRIIFASLLSGFLVAVYGLAEHFGIDKNYWVQDVQARVFSTLGQPNWLAAYLCILLPLSLREFFQSKSPVLKSVFFLLSSIFYLCLLFTKSKTGFVAATISLGVFFLFYFLKDKSRSTLYSLAGFGFLFLILTLTINNPIKDLIFKSHAATPAVPNNTINVTPSEDIRKLVWEGAFALWQKFPFFGTGTETFAYSYYWTRPVAHNLTSEWDFLYNKAHNEYLNYLATTGTFGILSYLVVIVFVLFLFLKKSSDPKNWTLVIAALAAFISILVTNSTGFSVVVTSLYFFILPSLALNPAKSTVSAPLHKPLTILTLLVTLFLVSRVIAYYLADLDYNVADSYQNQGYYSESLAKINTAITLFPGEPVYLMKQADILTKNALVAEQKKDSAAALRLANQSVAAGTRALAISPANINFYKEQAQNEYYLSTIDTKYYALAVENIIKATRLAPTDAKSFYILGKFWATIDHPDEAAAAYQKAIELKPNYDYATFALGELYFQQKNYPQAKKYFTATLQIAPNNTDAQSYLAKISQIKQ